MNKRMIDRYKKIISSIVKQEEVFNIINLFNKSTFETQELFNKLIRSDDLVYNFLNEEQAFMITYFSYLACKENMENIIHAIIDYISKNEEYSDIKDIDSWNFRKGMNQCQYYLDSCTFKRSLPDMMLESKLKFLKTYKIEEILNLKKFI